MAPSRIPLRFPLHEILEVTNTNLPITIGTITPISLVVPVVILVDPQIGIIINIVLSVSTSAMG